MNKHFKYFSQRLRAITIIAFICVLTIGCSSTRMGKGSPYSYSLEVGESETCQFVITLTAGAYPVELTVVREDNGDCFQVTTDTHFIRCIDTRFAYFVQARERGSIREFLLKAK